MSRTEIALIRPSRQGLYGLTNEPAVLTNEGNEAVVNLARTAQNLPGLGRELLKYSEIDVERLMNERSRVVQRNPEVREMMIEAWNIIIDCLQHDFNRAIKTTLFSELERSILSFAGPLDQSLALFVCLSEISNVCRSTKIASVLVKFFQRYGSEIVELEPGSVYEWGIAIMRSHLDEESRRICLTGVAEHIFAFGSAGSESAIRYPRADYDSLLRYMQEILYIPREVERHYEVFSGRQSERYRTGPGSCRPRPRRHRSAPTIINPYSTDGRELARYERMPRRQSPRGGLGDLSRRVRNIEDNVGELGEELREAFRRGDFSYMPGWN